MMEWNVPFAASLEPEALAALPMAKRIVRRLSDMPGHYSDQEAVKSLLPADPLIYDFWECEYAGTGRGLSFGMTCIYPGVVGSEYHMTKGHYHLNGGDEIYVPVRGQGIILVQTRKGEAQTFNLVPGQFLYVPGHLALRTINTGDEELSVFGIWAPNIEHDYETIARTGFRRRFLRGADGAMIVENRMT
jgi:glucose-6-phosphate isomerase, archaeal